MNENEFISLILPLRDRLFRIAWYIVRSKEEAEDIIQDVMIRIWKMEGEVKLIGNVEAYCYTMTRNLALNRMELKVNRHIGLSDGQDSGVEDGPLEQMEQEERSRLLLRLMQRLPEPQCDIIQLRDIEGMSYLDIASTLGLSEEQVKVYLFRARKKIKDMYLKFDNYGLQAN